MSIDGDLGYVGPNGLTYDTELDYVCQEELGFCECGIPEQTARWVADGLELIRSRFDHEEKDAHIWYPQLQDQWRAHFGNEDAARYFFWYWCDDRELTEHGGSVPGWLTDKGYSLLSRLQLLLSEVES